MRRDCGDASAVVRIEAGVWDRHQRRLAQAEAALMQCDPLDYLPAWITADELMALWTQGLPRGVEGFEAFASGLSIEHQWRNGNPDGNVREYDLLSFPWALRGRSSTSCVTIWATHGTRIRPSAVGDPLRNVMPPWVLPLARLMRSGDVSTPAEAMAQLDVTLPPSMLRPTVGEIETFMRTGGA